MTGHQDRTVGLGVEGVLAEMQARLDGAPAAPRVFLSTYQRTTAAVGKAIEDARFEDPAWVARWDVAFARLYLDAYDADHAGERVPRPWRLAFDAPADRPAAAGRGGLRRHAAAGGPHSLTAPPSMPSMNRRWKTR